MRACLVCREPVTRTRNGNVAAHRDGAGRMCEGTGHSIDYMTETRRRK